MSFSTSSIRNSFSKDTRRSNSINITDLTLLVSHLLSPSPLDTITDANNENAVMSGLEASSVPNSSAASDPIASIRKVIVKEFQIKESLIKDSDCIAVARISEIVGTRGARLSACALAACVIQTGYHTTSQRARFGADGSLVEFYPRYEERIFKALKEVLGEDVRGRCVLGHAKDGSGIGAALCAQAASKLQKAGM